jgi:hypothetical protein
MKKNNLSVNEFSFVQMFNGSNGKSSMPLFLGFWFGVFACAGLLISIFTKFEAGVMGAGAFVTAAGALVVGKTLSKEKQITSNDVPIQSGELEKEMD